MGGPGSGRGFRFDATDNTTEDYLCLDVRALHRQGLLKPHAGISIRTTRNGRVTAAASGVVLTDRIILVYRHRTRTTDWEDVQQTIPLEWTPCRYGGQRPWLRCPGAGCGRRVLLVYGVGKYFYCRRCYGLAYRSQREGEMDRWLRKARKARRQLGASESLGDWVEKPKGMHWKTFERLMRQVDEAEARDWAIAVRRFKLGK